MRSLLIKLHLYVAAFLAPMLLLVALSGGLYLIGIKGSVEKSSIEPASSVRIDLESESLKADVQQLLADSGEDPDFEYLKRNGTVLITRPTSRVYYEIETEGTLRVTRNIPDLQKRMIELHKGHGPLLFKDFQKVLAVGLLFIVVSGMWLGISSKGLRTASLLTSGGGLALFMALVLLA